MKTTLLLPTEIGTGTIPPAKFYTIDPYGNYIFIHTNDIHEAALYCQQNYYGYPVRSSILGHKQGENNAD